MKGLQFKTSTLSLWLLLASLSTVATAQAGELCLDPVGDLDGSSVTNVVDVQCELLMILWTLGGEIGAVPGCLAGPASHADVSCDSATTIVDGILLIKISLGVDFPAVDTNGNGCPDDCEADICGDAVCSAGENCSTCEADCGVCPDVCGDTTCGPTEACDTCAQDCGSCCGNTVCGFGESCDTCPSDCGTCCGNDLCDFGETCDSCPGDCGPCCGNNSCDFGETCDSCPGDCGPCCGNNSCDFGETCDSCPGDCGPCCGNNSCDFGETCNSCASDCGECQDVCGDAVCGESENCTTCAIDCGSCCGDAVCDANAGETCDSCPTDCGPCCGDGTCNFGENCSSCETDCGSCCGNTICEPQETCASCSADCGECCGDGTCNFGETCSSCEIDCGTCCGDGTCDDTTETCGNCALDCGECPAFCGDGTCDDVESCETCPNDCTDCGPVCGDFFCDDPETCESCPNDCQCPEFCGNGICGVGEDCTNCSEDCEACEAVCGNQNCEVGETCTSCESDCGVCPTVCGDQECGFDEDCTNCAADCGECVSCGDQVCSDLEETCVSCPADCGECAPFCGDLFCNGDEDCASCQADCGPCPFCGDETCDDIETCGTCEADCGVCPETCGNDICGVGEDCTSCAFDCGECPAVCGDTVCSSLQGEDCLTCPGDCLECICGDEICQDPLENCVSCGLDCGDCPAPTNSCCDASVFPGCLDENISTCVCDTTPECCTTEWTEACAALATSACGKDCPVDNSVECCVSHITPGCDDGTVGSAATTHNVSIENFTFVPASIEIKTGDTVIWTNNDAFHTVNSLSPLESFDSTVLTNGLTFEHTYTVAGDHAYKCNLHSSMPIANVIVTPSTISCEDCVCAYDNLCCSELWDASCVALGASVCTDACECGEAPSQDCCEPGAALGCNDATCMECVCSADLLCCTSAWDTDCALSAHQDCKNSCVACPDKDDCCSPHFPFSCSNTDCTDCVCASNDLCCTVSWDETCVVEAETCQTDCGCLIGDGCSVTAGIGGTTNATCDACVCEAAQECCGTSWHAGCVELAETTCNFGCGCNEAGIVDQCSTLWTCATDCAPEDTACQDACAYPGDLDAQALYDSLLECAKTQECEVLATPLERDLCAQQLCSLKYGWCHAENQGEDCCSPHATAGCPVSFCEDCVCLEDSLCCNAAWDESCVTLGETTCTDECVCVPTDILHECADIFECVTTCPTNDEGGCHEVCSTRGAEEAQGLFAPFGGCLVDSTCAKIISAEEFQLCVEAECTSSYSLCLGHQKVSECCNEQGGLCGDNLECITCASTLEPECANNWTGSCAFIAQSSCNSLCNCTPAIPDGNCGAYDGCANACVEDNQSCIGDCIANTTVLDLLEHAEFVACALANGCYELATPQDYVSCYENFCPAQYQSCLAP